MVLASEDHGHVLVTINITKAPVFAITINGIIISDNNHHHSHQYKQHLPHCPIDLEGLGVGIEGVGVGVTLFLPSVHGMGASKVR